MKMIQEQAFARLGGLILAVSAALTAGVAAPAGAASAPILVQPQWHTIVGTVNNNGTWTAGTVRRSKDVRGPIILDMGRLTSGGTCVRLRDANSGSIFGSGCFDDFYQLALTTDTGPRDFYVDSFKGWAGGPGNQWGGELYY